MTKIISLQPRSTSRLTAKQAKSYGKRILELAEASGEITAGNILDDARDKASPLHNHFEWDNSIAAELHRLTQARQLCTNIRVIIEKDDGQLADAPILMSVRLMQEDGEPDPMPNAPEIDGAKQAYVTVADAITDPRKHQYVLRKLLRRLDSLQAEFSVLDDPEVIALFDAINAHKGTIRGLLG